MPTSAIRKILLLTLELAVTVGALIFVLHDPAKRAQMAQAIAQADWRWLAAGVLVYGGVELLAAVRWKMLLRIQGFALGWREATGILFIGEFFLTFTPGLVGGDVMRVYYLGRERPDKKADALTAVLMDRILGMLSLIVLAAVVLGARHAWFAQSRVGSGLLQLVLLIQGLGLAALLTALAVAGAGVLDRPAVPRFVCDLGQAFGQFPRDWRRTACAFITTLLSHLCYYTSFCCAAHALARVAAPAPAFWDVFSVMPIENTLTALPISFAGIGLRESVFQSLLHDLSGVPPAVGALIGSLGFATKALWSLPGAAFFLAAGIKDNPAAEPSPGERIASDLRA